MKKLITILKGESISLRLIDWFVTNYCKKFNVLYNLNDFKEKDNVTQASPESHASPSTLILAPDHPTTAYFQSNGLWSLRRLIG